MQLFNQDPPIVGFNFVPDNYLKVLEYSNTFQSFSTYHYVDKHRKVLPIVPNREKVKNTLSSQLFPAFKLLLESDTKFRFPMDADRLCNSVDLTFNVVYDLPGFEQGWHLDNRFVACAGIINLIDNSVGTEFATSVDGAGLYYTAPRERWKCTMWLNTENNWHRVPLVEQDRKVILFNFMLINPYSSSS